MAQLAPYAFRALVTRMFRELETRQRIFDLPLASFVLGDPAYDFSVDFHGRRAATPFGPAAGPHSQLAQNIVLSWLAGGRIIELKTVQVNDRITVPRPCIDVRTIGFNVEWSQELTLEQSAEEYVKASMLIQMLAASGRLPMAPGFERFLFDISVGYDLAGITSDRVRGFIATMRDATKVIDALRRDIPREWRTCADLAFDPCVASTVTLSTFHGCPADEIERILEFLLRDAGLAAIVKLNPTLLGYDETRRLLHDVLGYSTIGLARDAFDADLRWDDMCALVTRVERLAGELGRGFGVKLTNTLVVENEGDFLPASEPRKYMSGAPLHVLAMSLVRRFRREFGSRIPLSFSGGIDRINFPDAVALGLTPITVCTDLLKAGGYARGHKYFRELARRMDAVGARTIPEFVARAYTPPEFRAANPAVVNTEAYVARLASQSRYSREENTTVPKKIGRELQLLDCLTCDKCVPVCPNDANFTFELPRGGITRETVWQDAGGWRSRQDGVFAVTRTRQIANVADLCNDCGNCDVICPEDGGPYRVKPRFFGSANAWARATPADGFFLGLSSAGEVMLARINGRDYGAIVHDGVVRYVGDGFQLEFSEERPAATIRGDAAAEVDLMPFHLMNALRKAVFAAPGANYVTAIHGGPLPLRSEDRCR